jgi:signal transduction histidine kinase
MLHSRAQLELRQRRLIGVIGLGVTAIVLLSIAGGGWLAGRVIAPVSELARRVRRRDASELTRPLVEGMPHDEVGELAQVFERYLQRIDAFVQRERAFAADASHELRTPLSIMQGAIEILQADERLLPDVRPRIERMARAVHGMSDLTSALLMLARERADAAPEVSPCPVAEVLRDQVEQHRHLLLHKPVELRLQLEASPQLKVERPLLAIAMGNLIRNAFAYTEQGSVSVRLTASELQVADTGPGIASDAIPGLFEPGAPAVRQVRGAGIGLPLVKRIADRQGWAVFAQNNPNAGALFRLIFTRS